MGHKAEIKDHNIMSTMFYTRVPINHERRCGGVVSGHYVARTENRLLVLNWS